MEGSAGLNQPRYLRDVLAAEWKSGNVSHWGRGCTFVSLGNEKLRVPSKCIQIRFDGGDLLRTLAADTRDMKGYEDSKNYRTSDVYVDPSAWNSSETG